MATGQIKYVRDRRLVLDNEDIVDAKVINCELVYGGGPLNMSGTTFEGCRFTFEGAALNMLAFLGSVYAMGGNALVESIFDGVRKREYR